MDDVGRGFGKSEGQGIVREGHSEKTERPWIEREEASENPKGLGSSGKGVPKRRRCLGSTRERFPGMRKRRGSPLQGSGKIGDDATNPQGVALG